MKYIESFDYEQDEYNVTIYGLMEGGFIMDIKDLHGQLIWGYEGLTSLSEAKEIANKEIEVLKTILDIEDLNKLL